MAGRRCRRSSSPRALLWCAPYPLAAFASPLAFLVVLARGSALASWRCAIAIVGPLQTVSNLLAALREDDFSIRARGAAPDDALGQVMLEVNTLAETLRAQRLGAQEATALLRAVMAEIDVAIFAFDEPAAAGAGQPLRRAAARPDTPALLGSTAGRSSGSRGALGGARRRCRT